MGCHSSKSFEDEHKYEYLASSPFFLHLSHEQLHAFARRFRFAFYPAGSIVFEQDEPGAEFYLIGEGECDITLRETSTDPSSSEAAAASSRFLCSKKKGDLFGERGVLEEGALRSATVTATEDCTLLMLTRMEFQSYMDTLDVDSQAKMRNVMGTKMLDSLREIDFLRGLDNMRLGLLANVFRYVTVQAGEIIFQEGDLGRDLFIISDGSVSVSAKSGGGAASESEGDDQAKLNSRASFIASTNASGGGGGSGVGLARSSSNSLPIARSHDEDSPPTAQTHTQQQRAIDPALVAIDTSQDVQFATLGAGAYFGEVSLMVDMPRTATVRAITRCLLLVLNIADFSNFVKIVPGLRERFAAVASSRIAQQFRKFNVPFFQSIPDDRFEALSNLCKLESIEKDHIVFREGDIPQPNAAAFYLVVSGRLLATKHDVGVVGTLLPPSYVGEVALVTDSPRTATIIADTRCVLLSLTKENFYSFFLDGAGDKDGGQRQYAEFSIKLSQRQVPLKPVLAHALGHKLFSQHLALEYSTENITFYDASLEFESLFERDLDDSLPATSDDGRRAPSPKMVHLADEIVTRFISADAETQVNIPAGVREECIAQWRSGHITLNMFTPARNEIFKLMAADSFKR